MKKLLFLLLTLPCFVFGQTTDATLTTQAQQIKNETVAGANTANRVGTHLQNLVYAKKSFFSDGTASGTDTYSVTLDNGAITSLTSQWFVVKFTNANSGAATLNINAIGAKSLVKTDGTALSSGDIDAGSIHLLAYDGTNLQVLSLGGGGGGSGTVTSVGWTGGIVSVATATTTPAFTIAGTSGGIPYFNTSSTWATSAALAANALVIGGGAGVAPSTTTTGTGVLTFLGTPSSANFAAAITGETGTGAVVLATSPALVTPDLGTPSAATLTNATGYPVQTESLDGTAQAATLAEVTTGTLHEGFTVSPNTLNEWAKYKLIVLGSDDTNNNAVANTLEDVGGLSFTVVTGGLYYFRFVIDYTSAATTTGCRWTVNGPAATRLNYDLRFPTTATAESIQFGLTALDGATVSGQTVTTGKATVEGFYTAAGNGTFTLRFASEVSSSAVVAKAGSICLYARLN